MLNFLKNYTPLIKLRLQDNLNLADIKSALGSKRFATLFVWGILKFSQFTILIKCPLSSWQISNRGVWSPPRTSKIKCAPNINRAVNINSSAFSFLLQTVCICETDLFTPTHFVKTRPDLRKLDKIEKLAIFNFFVYNFN